MASAASSVVLVTNCSPASANGVTLRCVPDGRLVAVQRLRLARLVGRDRRNGHVHLRGQVRRDIRVDFARRDEIAEVLAGLQQSCQQRAAGIASGGGADEREIRVVQAVSGAQLLSGQPRAWPRVGSAVNGGHRDVRKRVRRTGCGKRMI